MVGRDRACTSGRRAPVHQPHDAPENQGNSPKLKGKRESQIGMVEDHVEDSEGRKAQTAKAPRKALAKRQDGYPNGGDHVAQDPGYDAKNFQFGHRHSNQRAGCGKRLRASSIGHVPEIVVGLI